jgi:hypothetical protein
MVFRNRIFLVLITISICQALISCSPREARVNQKKIERERAKKHKQDVKQYNKAVKRHNNMQSKSTKASMKKTKKDSEKVTPNKH